MCADEKSLTEELRHGIGTVIILDWRAIKKSG